jgi:hypothetical protein
VDRRTKIANILLFSETSFTSPSTVMLDKKIVQSNARQRSSTLQRRHRKDKRAPKDSRLRSGSVQASKPRGVRKTPRKPVVSSLLKDIDPFMAGFAAGRKDQVNNPSTVQLNPATTDRSVLRPTTFSRGKSEWIPKWPDFPWDLQLPPCERQISSFTELDECMNAVPVLSEAYKLTYYPWSCEGERPSDPH